MKVRISNRDGIVFEGTMERAEVDRLIKDQGMFHGASNGWLFAFNPHNSLKVRSFEPADDVELVDRRTAQHMVDSACADQRKKIEDFAAGIEKQLKSEDAKLRLSAPDRAAMQSRLDAARELATLLTKPQ